jgi:hypothetical protein
MFDGDRIGDEWNRDGLVECALPLRKWFERSHILAICQCSTTKVYMKSVSLLPYGINEEQSPDEKSIGITRLVTS